MRPARGPLIVFFSLALIGLAWALTTQHVWEDYYITYRASKNLATGEGLVFTPGQRVHSFTSPLGVLLPALSSLLTLNQSDTAALWIFRGMSLVALGLAGVLLWQLRRIKDQHAAGLVLLLALWGTDNKIVDFSINGMETGLLLLFLAYTLWALFLEPPRQGLHLGLSWAGLMWSRPDSCIYIAALAVATLLFRPGPRLPLTLTMLRAGLLTTALYGPWFLWAWWYYGSPIPHTITAKGLFSDGDTWSRLLHFPFAIWAGESTVAATFVPAYGLASGWPPLVIAASFWISVVLLALWLWPKVCWQARVASFAFLAGHAYLTVVVRFSVPWYLPTVTTLGLVALGLTVGQVAALGRTHSPRLLRWALAPAALLVLSSVTLAGAAAWHFRQQQRIIETGHRRVIGEWLRAHRQAPDTVFLEPLGYIGYFSGLKMLDYPGLSSPEVVEARLRATNRSYPACWNELIRDLNPDWLVLRPHEAAMIRQRDPLLLQSQYDHARTFDVRSEVDAIGWLPGRGYLHHDAVFEVHRRIEPDREARWSSPPLVVPLTLEGLSAGEALAELRLERGTLSAHAPARLVHPVPAGARFLIGRFGIAPGAYADPAQATDGAEFSVEWIGRSGQRQRLLHRRLDPATIAGDRSAVQFQVPLPPESGAVELRIEPGASTHFDWTYWSDLQFELPPNDRP